MYCSWKEKETSWENVNIKEIYSVKQIVYM